MISSKTRAVLTLLLVMAAAGLFLALFEFTKNPYVGSVVNKGEYAKLTSYYFDSEPKTGKLLVGNQDAPITIIAFLDHGAASSKFFKAEFYPFLEQAYIEKGLLKLYVMPLVSFSDIKEKNQRYSNAQALSCLYEQDPNTFNELYFMLFDLSLDPAIEKIYDLYDVDDAMLDSCRNGRIHKDVLLASAEIERFGIEGINARFYIGIPGTNFRMLDGIPTNTRFQNAIRQFELIIGN